MKDPNVGRMLASIGTSLSKAVALSEKRRGAQNQGRRTMPAALIVTVPHSLLDRFREPPYGAKKLEMSRISWVIPDAKASTFPLLVGTIAMLDEIDPSSAFKVETSGFVCPSGHRVR